MTKEQKDFLEWLIEDAKIKPTFSRTPKEFSPGEFVEEISYFQGVDVDYGWRNHKLIKVGGENYTTIYFYSRSIRRYLDENSQ